MDDILQTSANAKLAKNKGGDVDISAMAMAVKNLPEYKQTMSNLGRHVAIAQKCMQAFSSQNLMTLSAIEQALSTGVDEDGETVKGSSCDIVS
jgi:syntaxin-binding protein 1